ncbi:hypothetical protein COSO111634_08250 [Corallococcus soli]
MGAGRGAGKQERIPAQEAAQDRVVDARPQVRQAEGRQRVPSVPLRGRVEARVRGRRAGRRGFAEGLVVDPLHEVAIAVQEVTAAARLAERIDPVLLVTPAAGDDAARARDVARDDRLHGAVHHPVPALEQVPQLPLMPCVDGVRSLEVDLEQGAQRAMVERGLDLQVGDGAHGAGREVAQRAHPPGRGLGHDVAPGIMEDVAERAPQAPVAVADAADLIAVGGAVAERGVPVRRQVVLRDDVAERVVGEAPPGQRQQAVGAHRAGQPPQRVVGVRGRDALGQAVVQLHPRLLTAHRVMALADDATGPD